MQTAAPAGAIIWILANITVGDSNLARAIADWLNPFGLLLGLDGVILLAYIIAIPANEIVVPTMMMVYMGAGMMIVPTRMHLLAFSPNENNFYELDFKLPREEIFKFLQTGWFGNEPYPEWEHTAILTTTISHGGKVGLWINRGEDKEQKFLGFYQAEIVKDHDVDWGAYLERRHQLFSEETKKNAGTRKEYVADVRKYLPEHILTQLEAGKVFRPKHYERQAQRFAWRFKLINPEVTFNNYELRAANSEVYKVAPKNFETHQAMLKTAPTDFNLYLSYKGKHYWLQINMYRPQESVHFREPYLDEVMTVLEKYAKPDVVARDGVPVFNITIPDDPMNVDPVVTLNDKNGKVLHTFEHWQYSIYPQKSNIGYECAWDCEL